MQQEEQRRFRARQEWIKVFEETQSVTIISRKCGVPRSTIYRWLKRFQDDGEVGLLSQSRRPYRLAKLKVTQEIEDEILLIRKKYKWGPQRIATHFERNGGPSISDSTIWRILKKHGVKNVKKYRRHKDFKRYTRPVPGDRVQIDVTKVAPGFYQYTAIDDCTRLKYMRLYPSKNAQFSIEFVLDLIAYFGEIGFPIQRIQTDCGPEFYNEALQLELMEHFIKFRPNPPGKPHLNGKVERTQKTDKEEFYRTLNFKDRNLNLRRQLAEWLHFYNYERPHSSLKGKTPHERFLELENDVPIQPEVTGKWMDSNEKIKHLDWEKFKKKNPEVARFAEMRSSQMS